MELQGVNARFGGPIGGANDLFGQGINSLEDFQRFMKAVQTAGDPHALDFKGNLEGVPAIRLEALEGTLRAVVERERNFTLFKRLKSKKAKSSVVEWSTLKNIGGDVGGSFHGEYSDIRQARSEYGRDVLRIKYLMEGAEITVAAQVQQAIDDIKARENTSATTRILRSVEWGLFQGDESVVPEEFDGIAATLRRLHPNHIIDLEGSSDTQELYDAMYRAYADTIGPEGGYGSISDVYLTPSVQNDLDLFLAPQWRKSLDGSKTEYGSPVPVIHTSFGDIKTNQSVWIQEGDYPHTSAPAVVRTKGKLSPDAPGAPTVAISAVVGAAGSKFKAGQNGTYYYAVASVSEKGEGPLSVIGSVALGVGDAAQLQITPPAGLGQTGFVIYRSKRNPATAPAAADLRMVKRIPAAENPADVVTFVDKNEDIPGASSLFILDLEDEEAIDWTQLLPMTQFPLYPTRKASYPWAVLLFGALKLGIPQRHWVVRNYVPKTARWQPF
ncbi:hypothetical protein [Calidithermus chliarophilus]|uniref:hypothetical protein n=1 Tax=Calidithermus chliarophilus TaxID=52023 RepID=UPI000412ED51|nr:hypothetical protein [Calidithermus chliarophilus]